MIDNIRRLHPDRRALLGATLVVAGVLVLAYLFGVVLLTLAISAAAAYILIPIAKRIERGVPKRVSARWPEGTRIASICTTFVVVIAVVAGVVALITPTTIKQSSQFAEDLPGMVDNIRATLEDWLSAYSDLIPEEVRDRIEDAFDDAGSVIGSATLRTARQAAGVVSESLAFIVGLTTAPLLVFFMMKDSGRFKSAMISPFPERWRPHLTSALNIADSAIAGYVRGQFTLGLIVGVAVGVGLTLMGVPFSYILGIVAGISEMIPLVGPWIGAGVGLVVVLATKPEMLPWVALLYVGVQLLQNLVIVPRMQKQNLGLHPVAVVVIVVVASSLFGLWGLIFGPHLVAMGRAFTLYFVSTWRKSESLSAQA